VGLSSSEGLIGERLFALDCARIKTFRLISHVHRFSILYVIHQFHSL